MLNDKEFEEIGKRLYDLEDDPPRQGWEKIASDLRGDDPEKPPFMWRNGWKFIPLLLIPVLTYWLWPEDTAVSSLLTSADSAVELSIAEDGETAADTPLASESATSMQGTNEPDDLHSSALNPGAMTTLEADVESSRHSVTDKLTTPDVGKKPLDPLHITTDGKDEASVTSMVNQKEQSDERVVVFHDEDDAATKVTAIVTKGGDITAKSSDAHQADDALPLASADAASGTGAETSPDQDSVTETTSVNRVNTAVSQISDVANPGNLLGRENSSRLEKTNSAAVMQPTLPASGDDDVVVESDSTHIGENERSAEGASTEESRDEEKSALGPWRISLAVIPQFTDQSIRPVANDETLVTSVGGRKGKYPAYSGLGIALGAGKAVKKNLYIDAQLSYTRTSYDVSYTYATGKIDTLLAQVQGDGTVTMVPVYDVAAAAKRAVFTQGGLRVMTTYYFWSNPLRRFSLSAGADVNYLLSAKLTETATGIALPPDEYLRNRMNYSLFLAAGYNIILGKGWEVMISPTLNYHLKKIESGQQPFEFTKRSYGLNVVLLKSLF